MKDLVRRVLVKTLVKLYHRLMPVMRTDSRLIVFDSSTGLNYTGSPRAVYERMVGLGLDREYKCVWFFKRGKAPADMPGCARKVRFEWPLYYHYMLRAGVWVFDARQPGYIRKRPDQLYIQTWHGTPLKKLALDMDSVSMAGSKNIETYKRNFAANASTWDCLIAQNGFSDEIFRRCFAFKGEMLKIGYPRNDILFTQNDPDSIARIKKELGLPADKRILLYAPTWRDDEYDARGVYSFRPKLDFAALKEALSDEYAVIVKYHYLIGDRIDWSGLEGFVYPFTAQGEISLLYLAADALITDYSSVMFDYSLLHRPMFFYAYDLARYRDELRGFYFDFLSEIPGPVSQTTDELIGDIRRYGITIPGEYADRMKAFSDKYHEYENGKASDAVIERIVRQTTTGGQTP